MRRISIALAAVAGAVGLSATAAQATPITVLGSVVGTGELGGNDFTNALVIFSAVTDTDDVIGSYQINNIPLDVTVTGLGSASFTDSMSVVANANPLALDIGFGDFTNGEGLLFIKGFLGGFALDSNYVHHGAPAIDPGISYNTNVGTFSFRSVGESGTFAAKLGGVPEPASWALMIAGFGLAGAALRRQRRVLA